MTPNQRQDKDEEIFILEFAVGKIREYQPKQAQRCHPNWSNDSYSKIFLRINVGPKQTSSDNCSKKEIKQICQNNFKFDIYSKKIYL